MALITSAVTGAFSYTTIAIFQTEGRGGYMGTFGLLVGEMQDKICDVLEDREELISREISRYSCNYIKDCKDGSDEQNCTDGRFYCISGNISYVRSSQVRNGRSDCEDGSDECQDNKNNTNSYFFNSRQQLIGNQVLYILVWIIALLSVSGNSIIIIGQIRNLVRLRHRVDDLASLRANYILVLNLAISDFLMGVYLLAVGIAYESLKGSYCEAELLWRGSSVCTWIGVTAFISSQTSVLTMIILTTCRLHAIIRPFTTSSKPHKWLIILLSLGTWILSAVVANLPLTEAFLSHVPDYALVQNNPFFETSVVGLDTARQYLIRSLIYYPFPEQDHLLNMVERINKTRTWDELVSIYNTLPNQKKQLKISAKFGYYNVHSICIADFFPRSTDSYLALSLSVIIFNFIAFLYIAAVYVAIYFISFKKNKTSNDTSDAARVQRRITWIIATNFLTWIPICLLSFLRLNDEIGSRIDGRVYQIAAIVMLPINSALNPLLYSSIIRNLFKRMCGCADSFRKRSKRFGSVLTLSGTKSTADL